MENSLLNPTYRLKKTLKKCDWEQLSANFWKKQEIIIEIDQIGIFIFREGVRLYGVSHTNIRHLTAKIIRLGDGRVLNLMMGEIG